MFRSTCTICTDNLRDDIMACPCGHVYHSACLTRWFIQSRTCPTCRKNSTNSIKLYFNISQTSFHEEDVDSVKELLSKEKETLRQKGVENKKLKENVSMLETENEGLKAKYHNVCKKYERKKDVEEAFRKQIDHLQGRVGELEQANAEVTKYARVQTMVDGCSADVEQMLRTIGNNPKVVDDLVTQLLIMKRENERMKSLKKKAVEEKEKIEKRCGRMQHEMRMNLMENSKTKKRLDELEVVEKENESLRKKLDAFTDSLQTSSPKSLLINRLLRDSPAPTIQEWHKDENEEPSLPETVPMSSPVHPGALSRKRTFLKQPGRMPVKRVARPTVTSKFVRK